MNRIDFEPLIKKNFMDMKQGEFGIIDQAEQWVGLFIMRTSSGATFLLDGTSVHFDHTYLRTMVVQILDKVTITHG